MMLDLPEIMLRLHDRNLAKISRDIGVSPAYLSNIFNGKARNPSYVVMKKLSAYLEKNQ
jgi:transcriptional regulator with XRE-family HTH domain